jgi:hypothetical protein
MQQGARQFRLGFSDKRAAVAQRLKSKVCLVSAHGFNALTEAHGVGVRGPTTPNPTAKGATQMSSA